MDEDVVNEVVSELREQLNNLEQQLKTALEERDRYAVAVADTGEALLIFHRADGLSVEFYVDVWPLETAVTRHEGAMVEEIFVRDARELRALLTNSSSPGA
jgi:hypothetical protein